MSYVVLLPRPLLAAASAIARRAIPACVALKSLLCSFHQISVRQFVVPGINIARTLDFQWCEAHEMVMDQKIVYD